MGLTSRMADKAFEIAEEIYVKIEKGESIKSIQKEISDRYALTPKVFNNHLSNVYEILDRRAEKNIKKVVDLHCDRYEELYQENRSYVNKLFYEYDEQEDEVELDDDGEVIDSNQKKRYLPKNTIANVLKEAMESLFRKEKALGFHKKKFNIQVNNNKLTKKSTSLENFDMSKLSLEEKIELRNLLEKTKETYTEKISSSNDIIIVQETKNTKNKHEVVEVVSQIQEEKVDVQEHDEINLVIDGTNNLLDNNRSVSDVALSLREAIKKQAKEALKRNKR